MYIFVDENKPPIDTALLVEYKKDDGEEILSTWMPKSYDVQIMAGLIFIGADDIKEFYNDNYDKILELIYPKSMLQKPLVIDGFYLDRETGGKNNFAFSLVLNASSFLPEYSQRTLKPTLILTIIHFMPAE
jgi:hypothetical protein